MSIIEFIRNPDDGTQPVLDILNQLKESAKTSAIHTQLLSFVMRGMEFLEKHGIPLALEKYFISTRDNGNPFTILLVKELKHHTPLLEFRMNWVGAGAFRAVFFVYQVDNKQILVFSRAVIKQETTSLEFETIVAETESIFPDFHSNPEKYITIQEVDIHE